MIIEDNDKIIKFWVEDVKESVLFSSSKSSGYYKVFYLTESGELWCVPVYGSTVGTKFKVA